MKTKYHILWIDDEWEKMDSFQKSCLLRYGLDLHPFKTRKEGLDEYELHQDFYEAAILDAKGLDTSEHEVTTTTSLRNAVKQFDKNFPDFPYFIFTGQEDLMSQSTFSETYPDYYKKVIDEDRICEDIIKAIKDKINRRIINKYPDIFNWLQPPLYEEVLDIVKFHEEGMNNNPDVFNKIRKALDWVMNYLYSVGVLNEPYKGTNLAECSVCIGKIENVPMHVQRSFHSTTSICNEASHRMAIDELVKMGKAPYLVSSTVFDFLNILYWLKDLDRDNLPVKPANRYSEYEGKEFIIEQDENRNYHCGGCLLSYKAAMNCTGLKVILNSITDNTTKNSNIYPYFAKGFEVVK